MNNAHQPMKTSQTVAFFSHSRADCKPTSPPTNVSRRLPFLSPKLLAQAAHGRVPGRLEVSRSLSSVLSPHWGYCHVPVKAFAFRIGPRETGHSGARICAA